MIGFFLMLLNKQIICLEKNDCLKSQATFKKNAHYSNHHRIYLFSCRNCYNFIEQTRL
uniref:Uncharacterized protein n=1 Tax=Anguilla anguilla TaxID=7936 RepID=A0A0E9QSY8_ANGAN